MQGIGRSLGVITFSIGIISSSAHAQYSANYQTNVISGVTSNWVDSPLNSNAGYVVGSNWVYDALLINGGGVLSNGYGYIGYEAGAINNTVLVSGTGSLWTNAAAVYVGYLGGGNSLVISNGGQVFCDAGDVGDSSSNNTVLVSGSGSVWVSASDMTLGGSGPGNQLIIRDGGAVYDGHENGEPSAHVGVGAGNNVILVSDTGSVWSNTGDVLFGMSGGDGNEITITNGGRVYVSGVLWLGYTGDYNTISVTGTGSVLNAGGITFQGLFGSDRLIIANGGLVSDISAAIAYETAFASNNTALVTDPGSVWSNQDELSIGPSLNGAQLTITNGGSVYDNYGIIGALNGAGGVVVVTGPGSVWSNKTSISIGSYGYGNGPGGGPDELIIASGGSVFASNIEVGAIAPTNGNQVVVDGGNLFVTSSGMGVLDLPGGTLLLNSGQITVDSLLLTNGSNSVMSFAGGTLNGGGTFVTNGQTFVVGNGSSAAVFNLLGGIHSFFNNLEISSNAFLTGCGTINGNVVIDPGGTVVANCGGTLTFTGSVTNNGLMQAIDGTELEAYGTVVNNGTIDIITGSTNFHGAFLNNGTVLDSHDVRITQISLSGTNVIVKCLSFAGHNFQLQDRNSLTTGAWTNFGSSQLGSNGVLTFTDVGGATNTQGFYRVHVFP